MLRSLLVSAGIVAAMAGPAFAEVVHLNCPGQSGQGAMLFSIDLRASTLRMGLIDGAGLVTPTGPVVRVRITDEIVSGGYSSPSVAISITVNRYSSMIRMDCRGGGCTPTTYYGPCTRETRDRKF
jgi:hypothetical protein